MKTLGFFFTRGVSVELWQKQGLLDREKIIYEKLLEKKVFDRIYWFSYGESDKDYERHLKPGIKIVPKPKFFKGRIGLLLYSLLFPFLRRNYLRKCSIFKTNQIRGSFVALIAKFFYRKPLFLRTGYTASHNVKLSKKPFSYLKYLFLERITFKRADVGSVTSKNQKEYLKKIVPRARIVVLPNFVDTNLFKPLNLVKKQDLVFVGRLSEEKNLFNLIKSMQGLNYTLDIYGLGELEGALRKLTNELNVKVGFKGTVPNSGLPRILNQYKLYVLPSFYEGMSKTLLEAMTCGLACLGTDVTGINDVITHMDNGFLVKPDENSIKEGIKELMENRSLREKLGRSARGTIIEKFSLEKILEKEMEIYGNL